jgi:hypothetical protein
MLAANEIREHLAKYLANEVSLSEFEDWLVVHSWNVHQMDNPEAKGLVHSIELRLSEFSSGHLSESALQRELAPLAKPIRTSVVFEEQAPATDDLNVNWIDPGEVLFADLADTKSSVVYGLEEFPRQERQTSIGPAPSQQELFA